MMKKMLACILSFICAIFPSLAQNEIAGEGLKLDDLKDRLIWKAWEIVDDIFDIPDTFRYGKNMTEKMFEYAREGNAEGIVSLVSINATEKIGKDTLIEMAEDFVERFKDSDFEFLTTPKTSISKNAGRWKQGSKLMYRETFIFLIKIDDKETYLATQIYARDDFDKKNEGLWLFELRAEKPVNYNINHECGIYDDRDNEQQ